MDHGHSGSHAHREPATNVMLHEMPAFAADEVIRTAVAKGMKIARVSDLADEMQEDMCEFGRSLPFARIYAIAMPTAVDIVMEKAKRLCLHDFQIVPAFQKPTTLDELPAAERALFSEDALRSLTTGEIAIHVSHRKAVLQCRKDNASSCLIFEEDFVTAGPDLATRWKKSVTNLPNSWEFLFMGRCWDAQCDEGAMGADLYRVPDDGKTPQCFHSYAVSRRGIEALLDGMSSCRAQEGCPVDKATQAVVERGRTFTVSPALFTQSAIQRILETSSSLITDADAARMAGTGTANERPVFIPECSTPSLGKDDLRLPHSDVRLQHGELQFAQGDAAGCKCCLTCLRTAPHRPPWTVLRLRPSLLTPERRLSILKRLTVASGAHLRLAQS